MVKKIFSLTQQLALLLAMVIALLIPAPQTALAEFDGSLSVYPQEAAPGADLIFSGFDFPPDFEFELLLEFPGAPDLYSFGFTFTNSSGELLLEASMPALPPDLFPDNLPVEAIILAISPDYVYSASLMVLPPIMLSFWPNTGSPGTEVFFTVENLSEGQLRLDYDGVPVFGPESVPAGDYSGSFIVPFDRPVPLGGDVLLEAVNLRGGKAVARTGDYFVSLPVNEMPVYSIENVVLPVAPVEPGELFEINGQISPPPMFPLNHYQLKVLWKAASGKVLPITYGYPLIQSDGSFTVKARVPSFFNGDALPAEDTGEVGVVLYTQDLSPQQQTFWSPFGGFLKVPNPPPFRIRVVDDQGNPIEGAIVDIRANGVGLISGTQPDGGTVSYNLSALNSSQNQIQNFKDGYFFPGDKNDPFNCQSTPLYGKTDADGYFYPQLNFDWLPLAGQKTLQGYLGEGSYYVVPTEMTIPVMVNAWYGTSPQGKGFGEYQLIGSVKKPQIYEHSFIYKAIPNQYYDADTVQVVNTNPLTIVLPRLPDDATVGIPIQPMIPYGAVLAKYANYLGTGIPAIAYGKYVSFSSVTDFPDPLFDWTYDKGWNLKVQFQNDPLLYGALDENNITLTVDGGQVIPFTVGPSPGGNCAQKEYTAVITKAHRLTPGLHTLLIQAPDLSGHVNKYYVLASFIKAPEWFKNSSLNNRLVAFNFGGIAAMTATVLDPNDPQNKSILPANLNRVGPVNNMAGASGIIRQTIGPSGIGDKKYEAGMPHQAINHSGIKGATLYSTAPAPITFGETIPIFNSGRIPLFRDTWGVWPIASATIGADMWFDATLTYAGNIVLSETTGALTTYTKVDPEATVGIDAWLDVSALFGAVEASAHAIPKISMSLPVEFTNGVKSDSTRCFKYRLDIKWSASVGYCPACLSESGKKNIFVGHEPQDSDLCSDPQASSISADAPPPPTASPSVANDGQGHTLAVWRSSGGTILSSTFNGVSWSTPVTVTTNTSSGSPRVAFFAPNQAVAIWTQNGLTPAQASNADFSTLVRNQHLAYSTWNGTSWSAPQNLTAPTGANGEGSPVLAGCLSTQAGCPVGGAVTAVWVRDMAGDLAQRQFRLFYATYQGGLWGAVQAVDPASTATDSEPTAAYSGGTPVVLWVRDADRDLGTLNDRKAAYRYLSLGGPVVVVGDLPAGLSEPSLAATASGELRLAFTLASSPEDFTGNQRQLYSAAQICGEGCTWQAQPLSDTHGRPIHAEGPSLVLDKSGTGAITYRALGFGPVPGGGLESFSEDSLGVISGAGDIAQLKVNFANSLFMPAYLTNDTKIDWQISAAYDPLVNQFQTLGAAGVNLNLNSLPDRLFSAPDSSRIFAEEPVTFVSVPNQADFALLSAEVSPLHPLPGDELVLQLEIANLGASPGVRGETELLIQAAWDGDPGAGILAGEVSAAPPAAGQTIVLEIILDHSINLDLPHLLNVAVNPRLDLTEADTANNRLTLEVGGLPAPTDLRASAGSGSSLVLLDWTPVSDPRVAGYRIYRISEGGGERELSPVGTTFVNGFADLTAAMDRSYFYAVVSFSNDGLESAFSELIKADTASSPSVELFLPMVVAPPR